MNYMRTLLKALILVFATFAQAAEYSDVYSADTLIIQVPKSEIEQVPIWKNHGERYDSFMGVSALSNIAKGGQYQCTELAHRFLNEIFGIPTKIGIGLGNANVVVQNISQRFGNATYRYGDYSVRLKYESTKLAKEPPTVGSAINFGGTYGHVAIVRYVEVINASKVKVYLIEQHGFPTWRPGDAHPIRSLVFLKNQAGKWAANNTPGLGVVIGWINFKVINF
jgi:hypothetical protein